MEYDAVLINGHPVHIAPAQVSDLGRVRLFYKYLSYASTYYRFFGIRRAIPDRELLNAVDPDVEEHVTLLATVDDDLAGIGEFIVGPSNEEAEVAFAVADDHHHRGHRHSAPGGSGRHRPSAQHQEAQAVTLRDNADMLLVFRTVGLRESTSLDEDGIVHVTFDLLADDRAGTTIDRASALARTATPSIE